MDKQDTSRHSPDPRSDPGFEALLASYVEQLNLKGFVDPDQVLEDQPVLGPALVEDLTAYVRLKKGQDETGPLGVIGEFTLRREIGRGGMGVVYEAWQSSMERAVALKVLPAGMAADDRAFQRFMREARAAGKLHHPNVVAVHAVGHDDNTPYYAMEYIEGKTLEQILDRLRAMEADEAERTKFLQLVSKLFGKRTRESLSGTTAREEDEIHLGNWSIFASPDVELRYFGHMAVAFAGVADGLQHAHSAGIVHRDIKPSNLILDRHGRLRILDFGLARQEGLQRLTATDVLIGTPLYMSPEQARAREVQIDHRTDIYSLGATLYETITGRPPIAGRSPQETLSLIISRDPDPPRLRRPKVPRELETIVLKCLRKEPKDRFGTAEALAQDLRRFARGDPIEARPQSPLERLARRARRHAVKLGVLLLALILLAVSGLLLHQYRINQAEAKAAEERAAIDEYRRAVTLAVSRIQVGEMGIHVTESRESGMDPNGLFPAMRLESLVGERTREPLDAAVAELEAAIAHLPAGTDGHEALYHLARALKLRGDLEEAAEKLDELKRVRPRFVAATILRAEIERRLGREEEAASLEEAAVTEALVSDAPWVRFWLEARRAERDRRWPDAVKAYGHLMDSTGAGKPPYEGFGLESRLRRGLAHLEAGELAAAAADFAVARHDWPDAIEPRLLLGRTLHVQGSKEEAKRIFQELYESQPPDQRDLAVVWVILTYSYEDEWADALEWAEKLSQEIHRERVRGFYLSGLNRPEEAEKVAREIIAKRPDDAIAHHVLALSLRAQKEFEAAIESCEKSISLDPENFASHATLARIIEETGHPRESIEHLRRAMELEPRSALVLSNLGSMLVRMARDEEERDEGEKLLLESYNIRPTAVACTFLAVLLELKKPPGFAQRKVELLEEAIELGPNYWIAWYQLGLELCLRQGNTFDGIEKLLRAAVLRPQAHQIHQSLGYAYERLGLRDDAIDHYNQAAELVHQEGIDEAIQLSGIVRLGSALARESDIPEVRERGIALLKEAAEDPRCEKMSPVLLEYATALLDNHKDEEALEAVQRAREVDPRHPLTLVNLAVCHGRLGKPEEALGELLAAFELGRGQYFPNIAEYTIRLFQEHRNAEFGEALERLRQGLEVEMARGTVEAGAAWNLWVMIQLWLERLSIEEVLAAVDELAARAPADTGDELKACAADVRWALERIKEDGAIRINCGGDAHRDSGAGGVAWGKDRFAQSGSEVDLREIANEKNYYLPPIAACDDQTIYLTQRCFGGDAAIRGYRVPVPPGDYRVTLHFVEMTPVPTLGLVFGIQLEGEMVAERFKPQRGGVAAAVRETFEVKGADALLEIFFKPVRGTPAVCAIEIERVEAAAKL